MCFVLIKRYVVDLFKFIATIGKIFLLQKNKPFPIVMLCMMLQSSWICKIFPKKAEE